MRPKLVVFLVLVVTVLTALALTGPAGAHLEMDPCEAAEAGPGHSGYAQHHVVQAAHLGLLGREHKPGVEHQGFSQCVP